jgi:hypothetical protein
MGTDTSASDTGAANDVADPHPETVADFRAAARRLRRANRFEQITVTVGDDRPDAIIDIRTIHADRDPRRDHPAGQGRRR